MKRIGIMLCAGLMAALMAAGCSTGDVSPEPVPVEPSAQAGAVPQEYVPAPVVSESSEASSAVVSKSVSSDPAPEAVPVKEKVEQPAAAPAPQTQTKNTVSAAAVQTNAAPQTPQAAPSQASQTQQTQTQQTPQGRWQGSGWGGHHGNHHYENRHHGRQNNVNVCGTCHGNRWCPSCNGSGCSYCTGTNGNCWICGGTGQA